MLFLRSLLVRRIGDGTYARVALLLLLRALSSSVSLSAVSLRAVFWPTSKVSQTVRIQRQKNDHFVRDNMTRKCCLKVASFGCPLSAPIPGPLSAQKLALK